MFFPLTSAVSHYSVGGKQELLHGQEHRSCEYTLIVVDGTHLHTEEIMVRLCWNTECLTVTASMPSLWRVIWSFLKQVVWVFHWLVCRISINFNCCWCKKGPENLGVYRMAHNTFLFAWISCDIQSTYPIVSVGLWLIDSSAALLRAQLCSDRKDTDE